MGGEERFFLGGSSCTCGRGRRQAPGEEEPNTRFLGNLFGGGNQQQHCGSCCYSGYNSGYNNNVVNNNGGCRCDNTKTFYDQNGNTHGACRSKDQTGRRWCYTTGWGNTGCRDLSNSKRFPNNPWSYNACGYSG